MIDPLALSSLTAAVSVLANETLKGIASEAGKTAWANIKGLLGWSSDPSPAELPEKIAVAVTESPEKAEKLFELLNTSQTETVAALVSKLQVNGGKVVLAGHIDHLQM